MFKNGSSALSNHRRRAGGTGGARFRTQGGAGSSMNPYSPQPRNGGNHNNRSCSFKTFVLIGSAILMVLTLHARLKEVNTVRRTSLRSKTFYSSTTALREQHKEAHRKELEAMDKIEGVEAEMEQQQQEHHHPHTAALMEQKKQQTEESNEEGKKHSDDKTHHDLAATGPQERERPSEEHKEEEPPAASTSEQQNKETEHEPELAAVVVVEEFKAPPEQEPTEYQKAVRQAEEHAVYDFKTSSPSAIPPAKRGITKGKAASADNNNKSKNSHFFTVLADTRSGSEWLLQTLDGHNSVCASQSFPTAALLPTTMPWIPNDSPEKGCTVAFVRESLEQLLENKPGDAPQDYVPPRCQHDYNAENDELKTHLPHFCRFLQELKGDYSVQSITNRFVDSFAYDNDHKWTDCACPADSTVRGLKVMGDWLPQTDKLLLDKSAVHGAKVVRLQRRNYFERYMSSTVAVHTGQWSIRNRKDKQEQMEQFAEKHFEIDVDDMLYQFGVMQEQDDLTNQWAEEHGDEILWVDYEDLRADPVKGLAQIYQFLGVASDDAAMIQRHLKLENNEQDNGIGLLSEFDGKYVLDRVANKNQVLEALGAHSYSAYVGVPAENYQPVQHILYDTERVRNTEAYQGLHFLALGEGRVPNEPSARFGLATTNALKQMPADTMVVVSDNRRNPGGGLPLNPHVRNMAGLYKRLADARSALRHLTSKAESEGAAVVISTSNECCDGTDASNNKMEQWKNFQKELASKRGAGGNDSAGEFIYLDGSFVAGKAVDVLKLIQDMSVNPKENDREALLEYLQMHPESIVLDYEHKLFGEKFDGVPSKRGGCDSKGTTDDALFVHPSRQDLSCHAAHKPDFQPYPHWEETGIQVQPILDHVERFAVEDVSMGGIERHFGKEIFYMVDRDGIQRTVGGKRDKYRVKPTEKFLTRVHKELMTTAEKGASNRWSALQRTIQSNGFMYFSWYGDWKTCQSGEQNPVPLFTTCAMAGCSHSFPMPNYMTIIESQPDTKHWYEVFARFDSDFPWEKKKRQVVWRGGLSENDPKKVFDSPRWRLCKQVHELTDPAQKEMFDVGLTTIPEFLTSQIDIDASIIGGLAQGIGSMLGFQDYTAVLDMDGNSWSSRFSTLLCFNQVTIKVEPAYPDYFWHDLVPWKHYVPVKYDLSDLVENVAFVLDPRNDELMREIAASANQWCAERLTPTELARDMLDMLESYTQLLDHADPNWEQTWAEKKDQLLSSSSKVPFMKLDENEDTSVEEEG